MESFYGGPRGQSFAIKEEALFHTRKELLKDLDKGWTSPVQVGEYALISYGMPHDTSYDDYVKQDLEEYGKTYNSTLWVKTYEETEGHAANGLGYKLLASMTGNTPKIDFGNVVSEDADYKPKVENVNSGNVDNPKLVFHLPQGQILIADVEVLDASAGKPIVGFDNGTETKYDDHTDPTTTTTVNNPKIILKIPKPWDMTIGTVDWKSYAERDEIDVNVTDKDENTKQVNFVLPLPQSVDFEQLPTTYDDADQDPEVNIGNTLDTDGNRHITMQFDLPHARELQTPISETIAPADPPDVGWGDDNTVNKPQVKFYLPRAARLYSGDLLGLPQDTTITRESSMDEYEKGDYYINRRTGFLYLIVETAETEIQFRYEGCIQAPTPTVSAEDIDPYDADGNPVNPTVVRNFTDETQTAWDIHFGLPKEPAIDETEFDFVGVTEEGLVSVAPSATDKIKFTFKVPRGSKVLAGTEVSEATKGDKRIVDTKPGDFYVNMETGNGYILQANGSTWELQDGSLKGPVGTPLTIIRDLSYNTATDGSSTPAHTEELILRDLGRLPEDGEVVSVTWTTNDISSSYWYYYIKASSTSAATWAYAPLTGNVSGFIQAGYEATDESILDNKAYSVRYVNTLISDSYDANDPAVSRTTFSKAKLMAEKKALEEKIDELETKIMEILSWGSIKDLADADKNT